MCGGVAFVQDDVSVSRPRVLRGVHGDSSPPSWSARCTARPTLLADNRPQSPTHRRWQAFRSSGDNRSQLLIPLGVGKSVLVITDIVYWYKQDSHFVPGRQFTLR